MSTWTARDSEREQWQRVKAETELGKEGGDWAGVKDRNRQEDVMRPRNRKGLATANSYLDWTESRREPRRLGTWSAEAL